MNCNIKHLTFLLSKFKLRKLTYAIHELEFKLNFYPYKYYIKLTSKLEADNDSRERWCWTENIEPEASRVIAKSSQWNQTAWNR